MSSPANWGKLVNFTAGLRKPALIPFGYFSPNDNLAFIASVNTTNNILSTASVAYAATLVIDTSSAQIISVTLTGNVTSTTLNYAGTTPPTGLQVYIRIIQNSTGGWTFSFPTNLLLEIGFAIDPGANRVTVLPIEFNGTNWECFSAPFSTPVA